MTIPGLVAGGNRGDPNMGPGPGGAAQNMLIQAQAASGNNCSDNNLYLAILKLFVCIVV